MLRAAKEYWLSLPAGGGQSESLYKPMTGVAPTDIGGIGPIRKGKSIIDFNTKARSLYNKLTAAEKANFDTFLRNGRKTVDNMGSSEYSELLRLTRAGGKGNLGAGTEDYSKGATALTTEGKFKY